MHICYCLPLKFTTWYKLHTLYQLWCHHSNIILSSIEIVLCYNYSGIIIPSLLFFLLLSISWMVDDNNIIFVIITFIMLYRVSSHSDNASSQVLSEFLLSLSPFLLYQIGNIFVSYKATSIINKKLNISLKTLKYKMTLSSLMRKIIFFLTVQKLKVSFVLELSRIKNIRILHSIFFSNRSFKS